MDFRSSLSQKKKKSTTGLRSAQDLVTRAISLQGCTGDKGEKSVKGKLNFCLIAVLECCTLKTTKLT